MHIPKKIILILITVALLWGLTPSSNSVFLSEKSEIIDASSSEADSENENCELENLKFFNHESADFKIFKISLQLENKDDFALEKNFSAVLTSPPNC